MTTPINMKYLSKKYGTIPVGEGFNLQDFTDTLLAEVSQLLASPGSPTNREAVDWEKEFDIVWRKTMASAGIMFANSYGIKQFIRQTHLDLLKEVEQEKESQVQQLVSWIERTDEFVNHGDGTYIRMATLIKKIDQFIPKYEASHIITRVEGAK